MALTDIEQVRLGIGDIIEPYILTDAQIQHYLDSNDDDINTTIDELQPIVLSALAAQGNANRTEDLWEDTTKRSDSYAKALDKGNTLKASSAYPMIGGATEAPSVSVDQFDEENNYNEDDTFYNGYEDI